MWLALLLAGCGGEGNGPTSVAPTPQTIAREPVALDSAAFESLVLAGPRPSLVEFWHPGCSACQSMLSVVGRLATDFDGRAVVATVNVDQQRELTQAHAIVLVPTFVFFSNGREVFRQVGATSYQDLAGRLQAVLGSS